MLFLVRNSNWKRELARDIRALGSTVLYAIVIVRILIDPQILYLYQLLIAAGTLFLLSLITKNTDLTVARALALGVLVSAFYADLPFAIFALLLFISLLFSSFSLGSTPRAMLKGFLSGAVSVGIGYGLAPFFISQ